MAGSGFFWAGFYCRIFLLAGMWNVPRHTDYVYLRPVLKVSLAVPNLLLKKKGPDILGASLRNWV